MQKVTGKQENSKMCFVCGLKNRYGLKAQFYETENDEVVAIFKGEEEHQGYPGRLHGGIAASVLDETIGRAINIKSENELWGVTLELKVKYKKPIPLGEELKVFGRLSRVDKRLFKGTGEIVNPDGEIAATAEGLYMKLPIDKIADFDRDENEWKVVISESDPTEV